MKKEDFKFEDPQKYIFNKYIFEDEEYIVIINKEIFNDDTVEYANKIVTKYKNEKDAVLNYMLEKRLRTSYNNYSDEYIKNNIGRPQITIDCVNDGNHPDWKFKYSGIIDYLESKLDEHIISIEFIDDLQLNSHVQLNG